MLLYQADLRFRCEHMERLIAELRAKDEHDDKTHIQIFRMAWEAGMHDKEFWHDEFEEPADALDRKKKTTSQVIGQDAKVAASSGQHLAVTLPNPSPVPFQPMVPMAAYEARPAKRQRGKSHRVANGRYITNRSDIPLCAGFQRGQCGAALQGGLCPVDHVSIHQCCRCLSDRHGGESPECPNANKDVPDDRQQQQQHGKGKGVGKPSVQQPWNNFKAGGKAKGFGKNKGFGKGKGWNWWGW